MLVISSCRVLMHFKGSFNSYDHKLPLNINLLKLQLSIAFREAWMSIHFNGTANCLRYIALSALIYNASVS